MPKVRLISSKGQKPRKPPRARVFIGLESELDWNLGRFGSRDMPIGEVVQEVDAITAHRLVNAGDWEYLTKKDQDETEAEEVRRQKEITREE